MQFSRSRKYKSVILFFLLAAGIFFVYIFPVFLAPYIIQKKILPRLSSFGYQLSWEIRKVGYFELNGNDLFLKKDGQLILQVDNFSIDYLFYGLGGIRKVRIVGLKIETNSSEDKVREEKSDIFLSLSSSLKGIKNLKISRFRKILEEPLFKRLFADTEFIIKGFKYCVRDDSGVKIFSFDLTFRYSEEFGITNFRFESENFINGAAIFANSGDDGSVSLNARGSVPFPFAIEIEKGGIYFAEESLRFDIPANIKLFQPASNVRFDILPIKIWGEISDEEIAVSFRLNEDKSGFSFVSGDTKLRGNLSSFEMNLEYRDDMNLLLSSQLDRINLDTKWGILKVPEINFGCEYKNGAAVISFKIAGASYSKEALTILDLSILAETKDLRSVEIIGGGGKIKFSGLDYGNITLAGCIDLVESLLDLKGEYLFPEIGYKVPISVWCDFKENSRFFKISAKNDDYVSIENFSLSKYFQNLSDFFVSGDLKLDYLLEYKDGEIKSKFGKSIRNFCIENKTMKMKLIGLEGEYLSSDPKLIPSSPSQLLKASKLEIGKNIFSNISLRYCLESPKSFFIENLSAEWCGGFLNVFSTRINDLKRKNIIIYFDRILLSELLSVIGLCEGSGDGRVNGKIPFTIDGGDISFNDAFFYSSPGVGGNIKMQGSGGLAEALPNQIGVGVSSVDLTLEALKDFNYDWSKITLNTDGEDIVANIEFLGRPSKPLPFHFDRQTGDFARVEADLPGSVFREIKLDLNCRLPLNAIMRYIKNFEAILK